MIGDLLMHCFHARTTAHVMHLTTRSYAEHVALNEFYEDIVGFIDALAEAYSGDYGLIKFPALPYKPAATSLELLDDLRERIDECAKKALDDNDTALLNIVDELRALISGTQYKIRFLK